VSVPAHALDAFVEARFKSDFMDMRVDLQYDDDALTVAQEALDDAEAELHTWVTVMSVRDQGYRAGYDARQQRVVQARDALTKAQTTARGFALPADLAEDWSEMSNEEKRSFLADAYQLAAVRSGRGWREDVATRTRIWRRNEPGAPDVPLAFAPIIFPDDASPRTGVTAA
jgi:hypothetical protein